jgi:hypothetical protein
MARNDQGNHDKPTSDPLHGFDASMRRWRMDGEKDEAPGSAWGLACFA